MDMVSKIMNTIRWQKRISLVLIPVLCLLVLLSPVSAESGINEKPVEESAEPVMTAQAGSLPEQTELLAADPEITNEPAEEVPAIPEILSDRFEVLVSRLEEKIPYKVIVPAETLAILVLAVLLIIALTGKKGAGRDGEKGISGFRFSSFSETGNRNYQEDRVWADMQNGSLMAVAADGMGGMENGAESAQIAVDTFRNEFSSFGESAGIPEFLKKTAETANESIFRTNERRGKYGGTTLVSVFIRNGDMHWISIGDSHIYLLRGDQLAKVNACHEYAESVYQQVIDGKLEMDAAAEEPDQELRKLTSNLGRKRIPAAECSEIPFRLKKGDRILLATDGIESCTTDEDLRKILSGADPDSCRDELTKHVGQANIHSQDNYSGIIIFC